MGKYKRRTVIRNRLARARRLAAQHQRKTRQPAGWQQHMQAAAAGQAVPSAAPPGRKQTLYNSFPEQLLDLVFGYCVTVAAQWAPCTACARRQRLTWR